MQELVYILEETADRVKFKELKICWSSGASDCRGCRDEWKVAEPVRKRGQDEG